MADETLKQIVKEKYGRAAQRVTSGGACCGSTPGRSECDPITTNLYAAGETAGLPAEAVVASLGCGNPTALADLRPGETVLDLGSGGGIDVLLSAKRVGPTGEAYGLDMTDEMLALARDNQRKSGVENVELWMGCVAGALCEREYREKLAKAGFEAIDVEPTRIYRAEDAREFLAGAGLDAVAIAPEVDGKFMSAFVRAQKPTR